MYTLRIAFLTELIRSRNFLFAWTSVLLAVGIYMWQWHAMPLFPDEVAFMTRNARFFSENGILYGRFAVCPSSANPIPYIFYPAAIFVTEINSLPYWGLVRVLPYLSIVALMMSVYAFSRKSGKSIGATLLVSAGFIGVAGSGLVMSRPEIYLVFEGGVCLFAYSYLSQGRIRTRTALLLLILLGVVSNISIFVHPQGLIFAPLTLMLMYRISGSFDKLAKRIANTASTLWIGLSVWYGYKLTRFFRCTEHQAITDFIHAMTLPGWMTSGVHGVSGQLKAEFFMRFGYFDRFGFISQYQINYLPPVDYRGSNLDVLIPLLNGAITLLMGLILLGFLLLSGYLLVRVCIRLYGLRGEPLPWLTRLATFATSNEVMFFTICWAHLGLLVIATQVNFYRAFYLNLAMVVLLVIAAYQAKNKVIQKISFITGVVALSVSGMSAVIANNYISPRLASGYAGPSLPLISNWPQIEKDVQSLRNMCGISNDASRVVVGDMTYDALKQHRRVLPITYIGLSSEITGTPVGAIIKDIKATAAIARCDYFDTYHIPYEGKLNGLCCATFLK
jgi:hypothetical protein